RPVPLPAGPSGLAGRAPRYRRRSGGARPRGNHGRGGRNPPPQRPPGAGSVPRAGMHRPDLRDNRYRSRPFRRRLRPGASRATERRAAPGPPAGPTPTERSRRPAQRRRPDTMTRQPGDPRRIVPTQLAAMAAGVTEATIRKWASRGKLTRYGRPGRAEYDLDEVILVLAGNSTQPADPH